MPKCQYTIKAIKAPERAVTIRAYPYEPTTLGDHLRKKRLDLELRQKDLAEILSATDDSVNYWENNLREPSVRFLPKIIRFIGYCPYDVTKTIAEKLSIWRTFNGITQKQMAKIIGVDPSTLAKWERGDEVMKIECLKSDKSRFSVSFDRIHLIPFAK